MEFHWDSTGVPLDSSGIPMEFQMIPQWPNGDTEESYGIPRNSTGIPQDSGGIPLGIPDDSAVAQRGPRIVLRNPMEFRWISAGS